MHRCVRAFFFVLLSSLPVACGGAGNAPALAPSGPVSEAGARIAASRHVTAKLVIHIPRHHRRARFVSPSTKSIVVTTQETAPVPGTAKTTYANLTTGSPGCSGNGVPFTCTVTLSGLTTGATYSLTFVTYDAVQTAVTPHKGQVLSQNTVSKAIVAGVDNTIGVILDGVPKSFAVAPAPNTQPFGGSIASGLYFGFLNPQTWTISTLDADGNFIIGPGAPHVTASIDLGATGGIKIASSAANPNRFTMSASGVGAGTLLLSAPVPGSSTPLSQGVSVTAGTLTTTIAGQLATIPTCSVEGTGADGTGTQATFCHPRGAGYNASDGNVYVADSANCTIRKLDPSTLAVTTYAGTAATCGFTNATGPAARFTNPTFVTADNSGNLYVLDNGNYAIRMIAPGGAVTTLTGGNGAGTQDGGPGIAQLQNPTAMTYDPADNDLYVADVNACTVRQVTLTGTPGTVTTIAGTAGTCDGTGSDFSFPAGIAYAGNQTLYVSDSGNCEIRSITNVDSTPTVDTVAAPFAGSTTCAYLNGTGTGAEFAGPGLLTYDGIHKSLYVIDGGTIRAITVPGAVVATIAWTGGTIHVDGWQASVRSPGALAYDPASATLYVTDLTDYLVEEVQL